MVRQSRYQSLWIGKKAKRDLKTPVSETSESAAREMNNGFVEARRWEK
jgi:hypothetical protein